MIDFERTYTKYTRFDGRSNDVNLDFDDTISVLVPHDPETPNALLFQLILLENEVHKEDYTVGWGIFPLLNEKFEMNEGKYKVPMLFGNVDPTIERYQMVEEKIMKDLDSWSANCYFEIERVKLMDLKIDPRSDRLYYKPVVGESVQEQQQMVNYNSREEV